MVGKIVKIKGDVNTKYVKIKEIVEEGYVGYGFSITNDAIGFMCNLISEVLTIEDDLDKMKVIDEVTFNRTFDQMINNMRYKHMQEMLWKRN